jgi:anti-sigma B factor antagonist
MKSFYQNEAGWSCNEVFGVRVDRVPGDRVVIVVDGEIDSDTAPRLSTSLHRELEHTPSVLILDLTGVTFLGVAGLHVIDCALARAETLSVTVNLVRQDNSPVQSALRAAAKTGMFPALRAAEMASTPSN